LFARRIAIAIGFLFALVGTQWPEFSQQYRQRLGGALDELNRAIAAFTTEATGESLSVEAAIARLTNNADPLARERGEAVRDEIARRARIADALQAMKDSGPVTRLFAMVRDFDAQAADGALQAFEPAVPLGREGWIVGGVGFLLGWFGTHLTAWPMRRHFERRRLRASAQEAARLEAAQPKETPKFRGLRRL
jgi:Protein of unknown function (DUF2937)